MGVCQIADRLEIALKTNVHRHERYFDELSFLVDDSFHALQIDSPVARRHDPEIEPVSFL